MSIYTKLYGLQKQIRRTFQEAEVGTYASGAAFFLFLSVIPMVLIVSGAVCAYSNFFWTKVLNPYSLLTNRVLLGKTEFVNLGGFPVLTWQAAVWISLTAGFVLVTAIYFLSAENCHRCVGRAK